MPTRSFTIETKDRRFWDISWDGPDVEIVSGMWGTAGRVRESSFASVSARDAFVAAEIAKIVKKGYRETAEIAPAPDVAASNARKVAALRKAVLDRCRPTWVPTFQAGTAGASTVRGPMTMDPNEVWPACRCCGEAMSGLLELDLSTVPAMDLRHDSLIQMFWCEAWERRNSDDVCTVGEGGMLARRRGRAGEKRLVASQRGTPFVIVGWTRYEEAPTSAGELRERFENASDELLDDLLRSVGASLEGAVDAYDAFVRALGVQARNQHKLGGFPTFVQAYERPFAHQIFQMEQSAPFDVNFGDLGAGHLLLGTGGDVQFTWASH